MFPFCSFDFAESNRVRWPAPCTFEGEGKHAASERDAVVTFRELTEADYPAVQALHRSVGWPERSLDGWRWLHDDPARLALGAPSGWLIDGEDGLPVAHVGNMIQRFRLRERTLYGATGFSIIVTPIARGGAHKLVRTFLDQPGLFAAWTLNANSLSQRLYRRHEMQPWPEATHALKLSWTIDPAALLEGRGLRLLAHRFPQILPHLGERLMNRKLGRTPDLRLPQGVERLTDLRDRSDYAVFWESLVAEGRLLSDRSPEALRRRLADPDLTSPPLLLAHRRQGRITGVAAALLAKANIIDAPVLEIMDLEALTDDREAVPALMQALKDAARAMGAAKLRLPVVSPLQLKRLGSWARHAHREGGWGHCHVKFYEPGLDALWSPTPWDGDYVFCLRAIPLETRGPARVGAFSAAKA